MNRHLHRLGIAAVTLLALTGFTSPVVRVDDGPGLSLRVTNESAPAGSIVQIKVEVTEAKPISTGHAKIRGVALVQGIALMNEGQDTYGVATLDDDGISFAITSPSSLFGTANDYPILGIAATVVSGAAAGTSFPVTLDAAGLTFRDPSGALYPTEIQNGQVTVSNGVSIGDVSPGSAVVPAGGVVRISGANFTPSTRIRLAETSIVEQRFINSQRIDVVLGQTTRMHGLRIRARNDDDRSESEYFSYQRTTAAGTSSDAVLSKVYPLFAPATYTSATVQFPKRATGKMRSVRPSNPHGPSAANVGFALQNLNSTTATVSIELLDSFGHPFAVNTLTIGPDRYLVRELSETFGIVPAPSAFRVRSNVPIQVLGLAADRSSGTATALPPG